MWRPTGRCLPPHAVRYGCNITYKSTVGTGALDIPFKRFTPYGMATLFQARFARIFFVLSFAARKKGPKKVLLDAVASLSRRTAKGS